MQLHAFFAMMTFLSGLLLKGTEHPKYTVVADLSPTVQIRQYNNMVVAEADITSTMEDAGNEAFHILAGYIFGGNSAGQKIAMTSPVTEQEIAANLYSVRFMMPSEYKLEDLPKPNDSRVILKEVQGAKLASVRYHGGWSMKNYNTHLTELKSTLQQNGYVMKGEPIWARYNSPMAPAFLRTNEILVQVE